MADSIYLHQSVSLFPSPESSWLSNLRTEVLQHQKVALEKLATEVKHPSTYQMFGCREIYRFDITGEHREKCQYIPQACPVNKLYLVTCNWTSISSKMESHLKQVHRFTCVDYYSLFQGPISVIGVTFATKHWQFIFAYNDAFYSCSEITNGISILFCSILVLLQMLLNIVTRWNSLIRNAQRVLQSPF
jgi:hypothetical protein